MFKAINLYSIIIFLCLLKGGIIFAETVIPDFSLPISFETALQLALERDPKLKSFGEASKAAEGQIEQSGFRPNPTLSVEVENFLGTGASSGIKGLELTFGINQLIETGEKRQKRVDLAQSELGIIVAESELRLAVLESRVRDAFIAVLLAQEQKSLAIEQLELAEHTLMETGRLLEAAKIPVVYQTRSELNMQKRQFALKKAERRVVETKFTLASLWGIESFPNYTVSGSIEFSPNLPKYEDLLAMLKKTAELIQYDAIERWKKSKLNLELAQEKPDFEVFGGARLSNDEKSYAGFVSGIEIPWPIFNKNQGNIKTAEAELRAVEYHRDTAYRELATSLAFFYQQFVSAYEEGLTIERDLLPVAQRVLMDVETGYEQGQFTFLVLLESREALFEIREAYLDALSRYVLAKANIETLTRPATFEF